MNRIDAWFEHELLDRPREIFRAHGNLTPRGQAAAT
jgi:hypothetical protein